jgi:flagellin
MIGGPNPISWKLGKIYRENNQAIANSLARIASGKRIQNASDDFVGFLRSAELQTDIAGYRIVKQDLTEAKGLADYAVEVGTNIAEDLARMKELALLYETEVGGGNDPDVLAAYESEFNALKTTISNTIDDAYYDGIQVVDDSAALKEIALDPSGTGGTFTIQFAEADIVDVSLLVITEPGDVQTEIGSAASYLFKSEGFREDLEMHVDLTDTIINSKEATNSLITDIDDIKELAELTDVQIRQQATVAMIAQANNIRAAIARLYQSE